MNTFFVRVDMCVFLFEITEITERGGVFFKAFRRFLSSIKMFLLKPRNACRGSRDAACCVNRVCNNHPHCLGCSCGSGGDEKKKEDIILCYNPPMKLFDGEHQIPILTPYYISIFNGETFEFTGIKIFIILRMWMLTNKVTHIHSLCGIVTECQKDSQISNIGCTCDIQSIHTFPPKFFSLC